MPSGLVALKSSTRIINGKIGNMSLKCVEKKSPLSTQRVAPSKPIPKELILKITAAQYDTQAYEFIKRMIFFPSPDVDSTATVEPISRIHTYSEEGMQRYVSLLKEDELRRMSYYKMEEYESRVHFNQDDRKKLLNIIFAYVSIKKYKRNVFCQAVDILDRSLLLTNQADFTVRIKYALSSLVIALRFEEECYRTCDDEYREIERYLYDLHYSKGEPCAIESKILKLIDWSINTTPVIGDVIAIVTDTLNFTPQTSNIITSLMVLSFVDYTLYQFPYSKRVCACICYTLELIESKDTWPIAAEKVIGYKKEDFIDCIAKVSTLAKHILSVETTEPIPKSFKKAYSEYFGTLPR
jgi:CxxC motif-containing protein